MVAIENEVTWEAKRVQLPPSPFCLEGEWTQDLAWAHLPVFP